MWRCLEFCLFVVFFCLRGGGVFFEVFVGEFWGFFLWRFFDFLKLWMVFFSHYEKYENRMLHVTFLKCGVFFTTKFPPNYSTRCVHACTLYIEMCCNYSKKSQIEIYSVYTKLINVCNELINELMKKINARFI